MVFDTYRKLLEMFDRRERRRFYLLCGLMVAMGAVEALGVASIMPFLAVVARPSIVESNDILREAYNLSGAGDVNGFLVLFGLAVFGIFLLSLMMKSLTAYALARFASMRGYSLSTRLMRRYLREPYSWFLENNSADLALDVLNEVDQLIVRTLIPALNILRSSVIVIFMVGLILMIDAQVATIAAVILGGSYLGVYHLVRMYLRRLGERRRTAMGLRYRLVQEAFGGIKEIKTLGIEERYTDRFVSPSLILAQADATTRVIGELPRHLIEGIAFGGMLILVITSLATHDAGLGELLPTLGLYAFAGIRLFPATQLIYHDMTSIRYSQEILNSVHKSINESLNISEEKNKNIGKFFVKNSIDLINVCYRYSSTTRNALDKITLRIPAKKTVGFVGGTGAGKTTAIDVIMGLLEPTSGTLQVDGIRIDRSNAKAWRRSLGYVPQQIYLADASVAENIAFGLPPEQIDMAAVERAAMMAELHKFVTTELPDRYATQVGELGVRLSGGQRQRIGIARALYRDPDILLLDEATSALDNLTEKAVMDALKNLRNTKTVIIIAHRLSTVRHCDEIFLMDQGRVSATGDYDTLVKQSELFRRMAGTAAE